MASPITLKPTVVALLTFCLTRAAHGKRHPTRSLHSLFKPRADGVKLDPYSITGNAAVEEDAADVPMDHSTAVTYVLSFCIIAAIVCGIFSAALIIKYRRRRRAEGREKAEGTANLEKIGTRDVSVNARDRFKRMGIFHPSTACLRELDYRLPCRCPLCAVIDESRAGAPPNLDPGATARPLATVTRPTGSSNAGSRRSRIFPRRSPNNENAFAGLIRTRPAQPVPPHEHEWTLFHGSSPVLVGSATMPTRVGQEPARIEPARLSQMSPLSSLRSSLVRELERPPLFSDDSGLSTIKVITTPKGAEDVTVKESAVPEEASVTLETFSALKIVPESDVLPKTAWISDADWILENDPPISLMEDVSQEAQCISAPAKVTPRPPLAMVGDGNSV
ncbi:hypothetical protein DAEQUDRAFT_757400 [Daedalea quercina L-15889]|uniref:Uncharacterized protein n=1 Tax=Daedalea quercina L-15889 TaxID=1314783 RepID=A0A165PUZ6_9APHY|nr:hypothetical protein DAEQUDRAFT_757400 [Daedalea quercina L-15889]